jgi:hypothetical protein
LEIGEIYKLTTQRDNYIGGNSKKSDGNFSMLLNSNSSSEIFSNLQKRFNQVNFQVGDILNKDENIEAYEKEFKGRLNVIIAPTILKEMEDDISKRIEIENKIFQYINEKNTWFEGLGIKSISSGIIFNSDGTVNYWSIPEEYEVINDNLPKPNQTNVVYKGENYRGEYVVNLGKNKVEVIEKRFPNENIIPLYYLGTYQNKEIVYNVYNKNNKENLDKNLLEYLKEKFSGVNIYVIDIENKDDAIVNHGIKCKWNYNLCISPVIFREMENDNTKELEVEDCIDRYLKEETLEKNLYKIFKTKPTISGIIFHKDTAITQWSKIDKEKKEFVIRQISEQGNFSIRKLVV